MELQLGIDAYKRQYGDNFDIEVFNRLFERSPNNLKDGTALLARPGTVYFDSVGPGPVRRIWSQDGTFGGAAFIVSGQEVWRRNIDTTKYILPGSVSADGTPEIDGTESIVFIADGTTLQYYNGVGSFATGVLTATGNAVAGETVTIGTTTYTFASPVVSANDVLVGATALDSLANLAAATLALTGTGSGTKFGTGTVANDLAYAVPNINDDNVLDVFALVAGVTGNTVATTETMTAASFGATTLLGGAANALNGIITPDDRAIVSLGVIAGFVLCVAAESQRVYFIRPGETTIDPLDFFSAERIPDQIISVRIVGDQIWLNGVSSTEVWYVSGVGDIPFDRVQGRAYSRGSLPGTAVKVNESVIMVGDDGIVYEIAGGLKRISTHGIENQIRLAREAERAQA